MRQPGIVVGRGRRPLGFVFRRLPRFVRAVRECSLAELAQLLEAAADLPALLGLVAAHGVEALQVEGGERIGLFPLKAGLGRAELGGGIKQGGPRSARPAGPSTRRSRGGGRRGPRSRWWPRSLRRRWRSALPGRPAPRPRARDGAAR